MIEKLQVESVYLRWAHVYELVFDKLFEYPWREAVLAAETVGGRILEVVRTGLPLKSYSYTVRIVGIDISSEVLDQAWGRFNRFNIYHVAQLETMDAQELEFPGTSIDVVLAQYVVNTVLDPDAALSEFLWSRFDTLLSLRPQMRLVERRSMPTFGRFALIRFAIVTN